MGLNQFQNEISKLTHPFKSLLIFWKDFQKLMPSLSTSKQIEVLILLNVLVLLTQLISRVAYLLSKRDPLSGLSLKNVLYGTEYELSLQIQKLKK